MRIKHLLGIILLLLLQATPLVAQQLRTFRVTDFHRDVLDLTARNEQFRKEDDSGSLYAIIKVKSDLPDDDLQSYRFDFGMMNSFVEPHLEDGEIWVYVQKNARTATIRREGFTSVNKHDLQTTIEAGTTYVMQLSVSAPQIYLQMVMFRIQPATAKAVVMVKPERDGAFEEMFGIVDETGSVAKNLEYGSYTYRVTAENHYPSEGRFTLNNQDETHIEEVTLRSNSGTVNLKVESDADIYVDGEKKGKRSWMGSLKAGQHQVECRQEGHQPSAQAITVAENETRTFTLTPPTPITGTLSITSRPLGADITIDGKSYGQTPRNIKDLLIGQHSLTLSKTNYKSASKKFEIKEKQTTEEELTLTKNEDNSQSSTIIVNNGQKKKSTHSTANTGYQKPTCFYGQLGMHVGNMMAPMLTFGTYFNNINIEASFLYGYGITSDEEIYWYDSTGKSYQTIYSPSWAAGGKVGYGFTFGERLRLTPQVGGMLVNVFDSNYNASTHALTCNIGARLDFAILPFLGVYVAPEFMFPLSKGDVYQTLSDSSDTIKGWSNGIGLRAGISFSF